MGWGAGRIIGYKTCKIGISCSQFPFQHYDSCLFKLVSPNLLPPSLNHPGLRASMSQLILFSPTWFLLTYFCHHLFRWTYNNNHSWTKSTNFRCFSSVGTNCKTFQEKKNECCENIHTLLLSTKDMHTQTLS